MHCSSKILEDFPDIWLRKDKRTISVRLEKFPQITSRAVLHEQSKVALLREQSGTHDVYRILQFSRQEHAHIVFPRKFFLQTEELMLIVPIMSRPSLLNHHTVYDLLCGQIAFDKERCTALAAL